MGHARAVDVVPRREGLETRLRMTPGDALILDNHRTLLGRTAFSSGGDRLLQGAYSDMDGLRSRLAVLRRGPGDNARARRGRRRR